MVRSRLHLVNNPEHDPDTIKNQRLETEKKKLEEALTMMTAEINGLRNELEEKNTVLRDTDLLVAQHDYDTTENQSLKWRCLLLLFWRRDQAFMSIWEPVRMF